MVQSCFLFLSFFFFFFFLFVLCSVAKSCLNLCNPMDNNPLGSSVLGNFQARILEWVAISFSRGSSQPRDRIHVLYLLHWQADSLPLSHQGSPSSEIETLNKIGQIVNSVFLLLSAFQILRALDSCHFLIPELRLLLFCSP